MDTRLILGNSRFFEILNSPLTRSAGTEVVTAADSTDHETRRLFQ